MTERHLILSFRGTPCDLLRYLRSPLVVSRFLAQPDLDLYDWQLTQSIARHPAGKGLVAGS